MLKWNPRKHTNKIGNMARFLLFFNTKKDEQVVNLDIVDGQHKYEIVGIKLNKFSTQLMNARCSSHLKNGTTCKDKWGFIARSFKLYDY
jgi:hypothetical protein